MKITRKLKITQKEFYDYLEREIISEIYHYSKKNICAADIKKGMKYTKNMGDKHSSIDVIIEQYVRGSICKFKFKTLIDTLLISYESIPTEDGNIEVIFNQNIDSFEYNQKNKILKTITTTIYLGRMCDKLYDIQSKIINEREGNVEDIKPTFFSNNQYKLLKKLLNKNNKK